MHSWFVTVWFIDSCDCKSLNDFHDVEWIETLLIFSESIAEYNLRLNDFHDVEWIETTNNNTIISVDPFLCLNDFHDVEWIETVFKERQELEYRERV